MTHEDAPATQKDLLVFKQAFGQDFKQHLSAMEDRLVEKMRDMQTELLRGFAAFTEGRTIRFRKV